MPWFSYCINDHPERPDIRSGYVQARSMQDAVERLADERVIVYPLPEGSEPEVVCDAPAYAGES